MPFDNQSAGQRVTLIAMVHGEEDRAGQLVRREELDLVLAKDFNDYGLVGKAICTGEVEGLCKPQRQSKRSTGGWRE